MAQVWEVAPESLADAMEQVTSCCTFLSHRFIDLVLSGDVISISPFTDHAVYVIRLSIAFILQVICSLVFLACVSWWWQQETHSSLKHHMTLPLGRAASLQGWLSPSSTDHVPRARYTTTSVMRSCTAAPLLDDAPAYNVEPARQRFFCSLELRRASLSATNSAFLFPACRWGICWNRLLGQ